MAISILALASCAGGKSDLELACERFEACGVGIPADDCVAASEFAYEQYEGVSECDQISAASEALDECIASSDEDLCDDELYNVCRDEYIEVDAALDEDLDACQQAYS